MRWKTRSRPSSPPKGEGSKPKAKVPPHLRSSSPPGSRTSSAFFDAYPRFFSTSQTTPYPQRLNLRYDAIFGENADVFKDARVLDIASHDGRWSFAALQTGASSVLGVEPRQQLVDNAAETLKEYGVDPDRYSFVQGDIFDVFAREKPQVDVVLCLGFLYHTLRYNELLRGIRDTGARYLIIDTEIARTGKEPMIRVQVEGVAREGNAVSDPYSWGDKVLTGRPSISGLRRMLRAYDFELERLSDWGGLLRDNPSDEGELGIYQAGDRVTARCRALPLP